MSKITNAVFAALEGLKLSGTVSVQGPQHTEPNIRNGDSKPVFNENPSVPKKHIDTKRASNERNDSNSNRSLKHGHRSHPATSNHDRHEEPPNDFHRSKSTKNNNQRGPPRRNLEDSNHQPRGSNYNKKNNSRPQHNSASNLRATGGPLTLDFLNPSHLATGYSKNKRYDGGNGMQNTRNEKQNEPNNSQHNAETHRETPKEKQRNVKKSRLSYLKLEELSKEGDLKITIELANEYNGFQYLLDEEAFLKERPDWIILITKLVAKVCSCAFPENKIKVLTWLCESDFLELIVDCVFSLSSEANKKRLKNINPFITDTLKVIETLTNIFQNIAKERFQEPVQKIFGHVSSIEMFTTIKVDDSIKSNLTALAHRLQKMGSIAQTMSAKKETYLDEGTPPEDFRNIDLYPREEEILQDKEVFLRRSIVNGGYENVEHYLDVQFRLLRQDLISPIRDGFRDLIDSLTTEEKRKRRINNLRLFKKSAFLTIETKNDKIIYNVCFDLDNKMKDYNWEYNRWFMFGSLLFFSFDKFNTFFIGSVFDKNNSTIGKHRTICVELIGDIELQVEDFYKEMMMVESTIFFQPYYHVMKALKQYDENNFPMTRYIIHVNPAIKPPVYLNNNSYLKIGKFPEFDILDEFAWPSPDQLGLDKYQFDAYKAALSREFVIMQGPPGTGKTYLGLKIIETLLDNESIQEQLGAPIVLVCYTNHALDQFLEGILKFTTSVVRFGSQTKSELIKPYEMGERRKLFRYDKGLNSAYMTLRDEMRDVMSYMKTVETALESINKKNEFGIVKLDFLVPYMSQSHQNQLKTSSDFVKWLLVANLDYSCDHITINEGDEAGIAEEKDNANNYEDTIEKDINEVDDDEDEVRNQLRNEESLVADLTIDEQKMSLHVLTKESLERELRKLEESRFAIERQSCIFSSREYVTMRNNLEIKMKHLVEAEKIIESQIKRSSKKMNIRDCTKLNTSLSKMNLDERWNLYWNWLNNFKAEMMNAIKVTEANFRGLSEQYSEAKQLQDMQVLLNHKILGITTTAAAKNHLMLSALKPKIVVVEEAAEVLEAHIVTALTNHCEHLILIGDHQQLRPNPTVYMLAKKYNLEISLFERMIKNNLTYSTLGVQHRMRPEICDLITPVIYNHLQNHISVYEYPNVKGITKNLFFVSHEVHEENDDHIQSYKNSHEGEFILKLARYLLFQGYTPDQITILTTYSGQMILFKMLRKKMPELHHVRISTVDNYQGEECEIILLSLVRSNLENKIGFLSTPNRVCVALSRAKHGFYLIGNMNCLEENSEIWPDIKKQLEMHEAIGPALELQCLVHKNRTMVSKKSDFLSVTEGGCSKLCNETLDCGHSCKSLCHPTDRDHKIYRCPDKCTKNCPAGHPCLNRCYEECNLCRVLVTRNLSCGHTKDIHCYIDVTTYPCKVILELVIELCGHIAQVACHVAQSGSTITCTKRCEKRLQCGHACTRYCHVDEDPDHLEFMCMKACEKKNAGCSQEHYCKKLCHEKCSPCNERVPKDLLCGHRQSVLCHLDVEFIECTERCTNILDCSHKCRKRCIDPCGDCNEIVKKKIPDCGHTVNLKCKVHPERKHCKNPCDKILPCGHQCAKKCYDECNSNECDALITLPDIISLCGHPTQVPCKDRNKDSADLIKLALDKCPEPCTDILLCEHPCRGTCSGCKQGRLHVMCKEKCGRVKICGHSCNVDCSALCPPCKLPCMTNCKHSKCPNPCGEKCPFCLERCLWECEHKKCKKKCSEMCSRTRCYKPCRKKLPCGHMCIGYCGEPCPPKCRICHKDEVTYILFGTEDEEDARFVVLEDCGHFFESCGLEMHLGIMHQSTDQDREIVMLTCPQCKTPVMNTLRFMNKTRSVMKDIAQVKKKQNGMRRTIVQMKMDVIQRLKKLEMYSHNNKQEEKQKFLNSKYHF